MSNYYLTEPHIQTDIVQNDDYCDVFYQLASIRSL